MFFLVLLTSGAVTVSCFHFAFNTPSNRTAGGTLSPALAAFGTFAWGADSIGLVLGIWLAGRSRVWRSWSGWLRAVAYLLAYTYGRMLFSAVQDWLPQLTTAGAPTNEPGYVWFRWPGAAPQDYARPSLDLLTLLVLVWLLVPVFTITRGALADERLETKTGGTFSIASIFGWTTAAAMILVWIRFLTWKGVSPRTAYSFLTPTQAITEYVVEYLPSLVIVAACTFLLMWGWSGKWWLAIVALFGTLLVCSIGHRALYAVLEWTRGSSFGGNVLAGSALEHWSYIAGQNCMVWAAFGVARLTGVRFHRSPPATSARRMPAPLASQAG